MSMQNTLLRHPQIEKKMYELLVELFPICRSLTGEGVRHTLSILKRELPELKLSDIPSGKKCFDWEVPPEWNIEDAYILDPNGNMVVNFKKNNLHVVGYSTPVDQEIEFSELSEHLFSLPDQPNAIPYITSYYKPFWGFCMTHTEKQKLKPGRYRVKIDSSLKPGTLNYADLLIPGTSKKEILLSTYICHPSMANNELSGPVLAVALAQWLLTKKERHYSYRIVFVPETIGSIAYLSQNLTTMKENTIAGFQLTCMGDDRAFSYLPSRNGQTASDRAALHVLKHFVPDFIHYSYLDRGSDERQYCSPGVDLPIASVMRSKYGKYPEYHTSLDNLDLVTPSGLGGSFSVMIEIITLLEANQNYKVTCLGEPQLGKRGLYPNLSTKEVKSNVRDRMNFLAYADGTKDLIEICEQIGVYAPSFLPSLQEFKTAQLLETL